MGGSTAGALKFNRPRCIRAAKPARLKSTRHLRRLRDELSLENGSTKGRNEKRWETKRKERKRERERKWLGPSNGRRLNLLFVYHSTLSRSPFVRKERVSKVTKLSYPARPDAESPHPPPPPFDRRESIIVRRFCTSAISPPRHVSRKYPPLCSCDPRLETDVTSDLLRSGTTFSLFRGLTRRRGIKRTRLHVWSGGETPLATCFYFLLSAESFLRSMYFLVRVVHVFPSSRFNLTTDSIRQ